MLLNPQVERMVKISLKGGIVAATDNFLSASTIQKFVPLEKHVDYSEVLEEAKKLGDTISNFQQKRLLTSCRGSGISPTSSFCNGSDLAVYTKRKLA
ncbi:hypothetical protein BABA_03589 [Neobacillus bataviensis LMG 21833]|uniref:Uncharacterized protein n=1 Tax=Neobacillus bataviensis LMG 21833 TaxID=1117379 RepID=K6DRP5_9BACI|nr:hypothetical protein [Neobacillus bataviensis]EKN70913.1 hypothetical protein BABA_03589 [Neobacillus bataviensis LMG 21833]